MSRLTARVIGNAAADKRKALLDGMLFEVFYDPKARLREEFKTRRSSSFDFIAECLLPDPGRFHSIPGKNHPLVVDVVTTPDPATSGHVLESLHCGGASILWLEDDDYAAEPGEPPMREKLGIEKFEERLAEQMVVSAHLLTINYLSFRKKGHERIHFPYGWTARKP